MRQLTCILVLAITGLCACGEAPPSEPTVLLHGRSSETLPDATTLAARVAALEAKIAYLNDRQQIRDVYLRYMRGFDRNDVDLLRSAFWPDVQINYGNQVNSFDEFVLGHLDSQTKRHANFAHLISNDSVDITGDVAHVEIYVTQLISGKNGKSMIVSGRYIDRLDRRHGEWRIAVREFIPHFWTDTSTALDAHIKKSSWWSQADCGMGTWDKRDPSYRRPLSRRANGTAGPGCAK